MAVSPSIVSGRVVATIILSSTPMVSYQRVDISIKRICQTRALNGICKRRDDTELELLFGVITWHAQKRALLELFLVDLGQ